MKIQRLLTVLLLITAMSGCIREDLDDCPTGHNVVLHFNYVYQGSNNLFGQRVENVEIIIFDMDGNFVTSFFSETSDIDESGAAFSLPPGTYRIVCWGNIFTHTDVQEGSNITAARVYHTGRSQGEADNGDPLFYAPRIRNLNDPDADILTITVPERGSVEKLIDFTAAHKTVEVVVTGFSDNGNITPQIEFTNQPSAYDFFLRTIPGQPMDYFQDSQVETRAQNMAVATFNLPLFERDNTINIRIIRPSTGAVIHTISLKQYLIDNNITLTHGDWDFISILVVFNDLGAVISVKPWDGTNVSPGS